MAELKTNYKDQILDSLINTKRVYNLVDNDGNVVQENVSLEDATVYSQDGDNFGAADINKTNEMVNQVNRNLGGCALEQEGEDFFIVGADSVRKKLGSSTIYNLGANRTVDISEIVGIENVGKYSEDNFILEYISVDTQSANSGSWGYAIPTSYGHVECSLSEFIKSYDNTTGILTLSGGVLKATGYTRDTTNNSNKNTASTSYNINPIIYFVESAEIVTT